VFRTISEQTVAFALYSINCLVFITGMDCVYCAVRTGSLNKTDHNFKVTYAVVFSYFIVVLTISFIN